MYTGAPDSVERMLQEVETPPRARRDPRHGGSLSTGSRGDAAAAHTDDDQTPVRGPTTLKNQEKKLKELENENFNLKLRIFHMEESMKGLMGDGTTEGDLVKRSITLKVSLDTCKKELADKSALLEQAKGSIERIIASYDEKLRVADDERRRLVREAADSRAAAEDLRARLEEANNARDAQGRQIDHLNDVVHQLEREVQAYQGADSERDRAEARLRSQEAESAELRRLFESRESAVQEANSARMLVQAQEETIADWRARCQALEERLQASAGRGSTVDVAILEAKDEVIRSLKEQLRASSGSHPRDEIVDTPQQRTATLPPTSTELHDSRARSEHAASATAPQAQSLRDDVEKIRDLQRQLTTKDTKIAELMDRCDALERHAERAERRAAAASADDRRGAAVEDLEALLKQHEESIEDLRMVVADRDQLIADLRSELRARQSAAPPPQQRAPLPTASDTAGHAPGYIDALKEELTDKNQLIQHLRDVIASRTSAPIASAPMPDPPPTRRSGGGGGGGGGNDGGSGGGGRGGGDGATATQAKLASLEREMRSEARASAEAVADNASLREALDRSKQALESAMANNRAKDQTLRELTEKLSVYRLADDSKNLSTERRHVEAIAALENELRVRDSRIAALEARAAASGAGVEAALEQAEGRAAAAEHRLASYERSAEAHISDLQRQLAEREIELGHLVERRHHRPPCDDRSSRAPGCGCGCGGGSGAGSSRRECGCSGDKHEHKSDVACQAQLVECEATVSRLGARLAGEQARADEAVARMCTNDAALKRVQLAADEAARSYAAAMHDMHVARDELERRLDDAALENDELRRAMTRQMADLDEVTRRLRESENELATSEENKRQLSHQNALIRRLEGDNDHLSKTEKALTERLGATEAELDAALRELKRATSEVLELRNQNVVLENEARVTRSVAEEAEQNATIVIKDLHSKLDHLRDDLDRARDDLAKLKAGFVEKETLIIKLQKDLKQCCDCCEERQRAIDQMSADIRLLEDELRHRDRSMSEMDVVIARQGEELAGMDQLAAELTATRAQLQACAADKARMQADIDRLQAELDRRCDRVSQLEDELARLRAEKRELQSKYDALLMENEEVLVRFDAAGGRLSDLVALLDEREHTIADLTGSLRDATEKLAWAQDEMDRLHDEIGVLHARIAELEPLGAIQAERRALQEELETLLSVRDDNYALQAECDKLAHACEDLQEQLQRAVAAQAEAEHARLVAEGRVAEAAEDARLARCERDRLQAELDHHAAARAELLRKQSELETEIAQLQRLYEDAAQDREMLSHQLRTVTTDAEAAHRQFLVADADRRDLRERVDSLSRTLEEKSEAVNSARCERDRAKSEIAACRAELDRERLMHSETSHELERARLKLESSVEEFSLAVAANDEHRARTEAMCRDIDQLTVELTRSERRREELEHDVGALRHDNEVMAARLESAARERAVLADKLSARTGPALHELATENALLKQNLAETASLAEQLREQLMRKMDDKADTAREMQAAIDLLRRTKAMLQEEDRHIRRSGGFARR